MRLVSVEVIIVIPHIRGGRIAGEIFVSDLVISKTGGGEGAEALVLDNASILDDGVACEGIGLDMEASTERRARRKRSGANRREESESTSAEYPSVVLESIGDYECLRTGQFIELQVDDNGPLDSSTVAESVVE